MFNKTNLDFDAAKTVKDILDQLKKAIPSWSFSTPLLVDMWPWEHIMVWEVPLHMCCFYWFMNKAVLASGLAKWSKVGIPSL